MHVHVPYVGTSHSGVYRDAMDARRALDERAAAHEEQVADLEQQAADSRSALSVAEGKLVAAEQQVFHETGRGKDLEATAQCASTTADTQVTLNLIACLPRISLPIIS